VTLKRKINFTKGPRKKIRNQNNEDQIEKLNIINLNWMMKLKTNKTFTKRVKEKKIEIERIRTKLKNIIFDKLRLND